MNRARLYVGNISFTATEADLRAFFHDFKLTDVKIILDRETGRSRGFAFVELQNMSDIEPAIRALNRQDMGGRAIIVSEAHDRPQRPPQQTRTPRDGKSWQQ